MMMEQVVSKFLKSLGIPISDRYIHRLIQAHPDFPSLLSVSDTLQRLGIQHAVHRIEKDALANLPFPYLLPVDNDVLLIKDAAGLSKYKKELEHWSGVVLQSELPVRSRDKTNNLLSSMEVLLRKYLVGIACLLVLQFIVLPFLNYFSWLTFSLVLLALLGSVVGYFLISKELGISHEKVDAFCNAGKNSNCDQVLRSNIRLLGLSFSDAVAIYFPFQLIVLTSAQYLPVLRSSYLQMLASISMLTIPIVLFSLYYQYTIVKTWCRLCLIVAVILFSQAFVIGLGMYMNEIKLLDTVTIHSILMPALLIATLTLIVLAVKTKVDHAARIAQVEVYANRVKHAVPVFARLLSQQRKIDNSTFNREITLGDPDAPVKLIMATNLYCAPCKAMHVTLAELLELYSGYVSLTLRFVQSGGDETTRIDTVPSLLGYWLENIEGKADEGELTEKLISDWFRLGDLTKFKQQYQVSHGRADEANHLAQRHYTWALQESITATPTFFVNGYAIPKDYTVEEVIMMAPGLAGWMVVEKEQLQKV